MACSALLVVTGCCLLPEIERTAQAVPIIAAAFDGFAQGWRCLRGLEWAMAAGAAAGAWMFQARCLQICYPEAYDPADISGPAPEAGGTRLPHAASGSSRRRQHGFAIADMPIDHDALRTSILVTGRGPGPRRPPGVLMPAVAQLFQAYHRETDDELSGDEFQKIGAFIPEVKGDLVDGCIYLAHEAGRCVSRDVIILSPSCRIPVVRYRDESGRFWFLSGRGGAGGSDAGECLPRIRYPEEHPSRGPPRARERL